MHSWALPIAIFLVWAVWVVACASDRAVEDARSGIPEEQRGGVSILPGFPVFPLMFWGVAAAIDYFATPWGTLSVAALHAVLAVTFIASIVRNQKRLRALERHP